MTNTMHLTKTMALEIARDAMIDGRIADAVYTLTAYAHFDLDYAMELVAPSVEPKMGDILCCSWGYDQTNVDFYQVIKVTTASVRVRQIKSRIVEGQAANRTQNKVMPCPGQWDDENAAGKLHRVRRDSDRLRWMIDISSYSTAYSWDGAAESETASGYGH